MSSVVILHFLSNSVTSYRLVLSHVKYKGLGVYCGIFLYNTDSSVVLEHTSRNLPSHAIMSLLSHTHIKSMKLTGMSYETYFLQLHGNCFMRILPENCLIKCNFVKRIFKNGSQGCDMTISLEMHYPAPKQRILAQACSLEGLCMSVL